MSASRQLSVGEATLNVVGVSIKAVKIGKKQMTMAVFRQLQNEPVWDLSVSKPRGIVWGRVNYFWDGCGCEQFAGDEGSITQWIDNEKLGADVHIIWQLGEELRRSCLVPLIGEATSGHPFACEGDDGVEAMSNAKARSWKSFYEKQIRTSDQLFIAV